MARSRVLLGGLLALLLPALLIFPGPAGNAQSVSHLVISEVFYDAPQTGTDTAYEWVEISNPTAAAVDLTGWALRDNNSQDALPPFVLGPGQYLVIAATADGFAANYPGFSGNLVTLGGAIGSAGIGNGLGNTGDRVSLLDSGGNPVDAMSYGSDTTAFNPACPTVAAGQSLARVPPGQDSDTKADWLAQAAPNPGGPGVAPPTATPTSTSQPTNTPTSTLTPTATATPTATRSTARPGDVVINEIMQNPAAVLDSAGEWFELFNASAAAIDLNGWTIRDDGSDSHRIQNGGPLWLPAGGYLVLGNNATFATNGGVSGPLPLQRLHAGQHG